MNTAIVSAPANIAFIKYWGKSNSAMQWPTNDSISMTLEYCRTFLHISPRLVHDEIYFENKILPASSKQYIFLDTVREKLGVSQKFKICTHNTFPSACGIASSASFYAGLTFGLSVFLQQTADTQKLTDIARLGSGSACRSLMGGFVHWHRGENPSAQEVSAIPSSLELDDLIVIVSKQQKKYPSSLGHEAAIKSPLMPKRLENILNRIKIVHQALLGADFATLAEICEEDSNDMHAVASTSIPPIQYHTPSTHKILAWTKKLRRSGIAVFFTVDAGPNVHLLCKTSDTQRVADSLIQNFPQFEIIKDTIGSGPRIEKHFPGEILSC